MTDHDADFVAPDPARPASHADRRGREAQHVAERRERHALPAAAESDYRISVSAPVVAPSDSVQIELPLHDPVITPAAARALLRLIQRSARREKPPNRKSPTPE